MVSAWPPRSIHRPFWGRGAAACSQANSHLYEQALGGIRASGWLRELGWRRRHEVARARIRTAGGSPLNERPFPSLHSRASAGCARPGTTSPATGRDLTTRNSRHAPRRRTDRATWRAGHDVDEEQLAQESLSPIGPIRHRRGPGSARCRAPAGEAREEIPPPASSATQVAVGPGRCLPRTRSGAAMTAAGRRARFPSPPHLRGRGQRPAFLPAEGEGRPLARKPTPASTSKLSAAFEQARLPVQTDPPPALHLSRSR